MKNLKQKDGRELSVRDLYPELSEEELEEAKENLDRYVALVLRIHERIQTNPEAYTEFKHLTGSEKDAAMDGMQRSNTNTKILFS